MRSLFSLYVGWPQGLIASLVVFIAFSGCQKPQPVGWEGRYCYRWKEEFSGDEKDVEYLNTCSGEHEELEVSSSSAGITVNGPEGARTYTLVSSSEGQVEASHVDCNGNPYVIKYHIFKVGRNVLFETEWNEGEDHLRRTSYTVLK